MKTTKTTTTSSTIYTKEYVKQMLLTNNKWLFNGIKAIYKFQTEAEKVTDSTKENNGVGFNAVDAVILSSFARQIKSWEETTPKRFPMPLSTRQIELARNKMKKYAKQLTKIANTPK